MEGVRLRRAMELFKRACVLDAGGRSALLDAECASDMELRGRVEALLAEDSRSMSVLDAPGGGVPMLARQLASLHASRIGACAPAADRAPLPVLAGDYRIIRVIGEGGMGTVYEAEQAIPRRRVALKAIREGLTSPQLVRRFEHEAHILGRLHHPGIAQIYEAGAADAEHPHLAFIAMEYVAGAPLTDHADSAKLTLRERVELVVKACEAVHHAHQRGVIHRDLKPTNILVDENGQPKILDFGVARAIDAAEAAMTTMHTMAGQLVGTIAYMSPEQVSGDPDEVDLRSDVYALGVILYRLLSGQLPYDLSRGTIPEMARIIRESEPAALSTINRALRGDLETIAGKALEKDKGRRYQSAAELADDLRSWLAGAPIAAKRDSALYVLRKTIRRYKVAASAAAVVLVISIGASVALLGMYRESRRQAELARVAQTQAQEAEAQQRQEAQRARVEAQRATAIAGFLEQTLRAGDPNVAQGRERTVLDALQDATGRVDAELSGDPPVQASVHQTIGDTYMGLGRYAEAETHYAAAAGVYESLGAAYAEKLAQVQTFLAGMMQEQGRYAEAEVLFRETLEVHREMYGERHSAIAADLAALGTVRRLRGDLAGAEEMLREALDLRRALIEETGDETGLIATLGRLVGVLTAQERWADAEPYARESLELAVRRNGPRHPNVPLGMNNLAAILEKKGALEEAEPLYRESLALVKEINGPDHVTVSVAELNLAKLLTGRAEYGEAEELFSDCIRIRRAGFGERSPQLAVPLTNYGYMLMLAGRAAEGEAPLRESMEILLQAREVDPSLLPSAEKTLAACLIELERYEEAESLLLSAQERLVGLRGVDHPATADVRERLAALYEQWEKAGDSARGRSERGPAGR